MRIIGGNVAEWIWVATGGALGSVLRHGIAGTVNRWGDSWPHGTLTVNIVGSFAIGIISTLGTERFLIPSHVRLLLIVGLLGGFTTFSAFSMETVTLFQGGEAGGAFSNLALSVLGCLFAAWVGISIAKLF
jgi:CrcB protein